MKRLTATALLIGVALATALVTSYGAGEVAAAFAGVGWATALVVGARTLAVGIAGLGWFALFGRDERPSLRVCVLLRFVREGANNLLPTAQIGGDVIGGRLLTFFRVEPALAGASVVVDVLVQAATQLAFALTGLVVLVALVGDSGLVRPAALGLGVAALALASFAALQRRTGARVLTAVAGLAGRRGQAALALLGSLHERLRAFHARPRRLAASFGIHLGGWFVGVAEIWIALWSIGHPVTVAEALVMESLAQALRGAAFAVPGAVGVQEGGLIALGALFGVPPQTALAVSLVKRVADLGVGVPGLVAWQVLEGRKLAARSGGARWTATPRRSDPSPNPVLET